MKLSFIIFIILSIVYVKVSGADNLKTKPNIIILFTDDHRYDGVHALGNKQIKTPSLDKLINNGVTFTNAYLQGANSAATCSPSRAQLLTGRGVFDIPKGNGRSFPESMTSIPMAFKDAGYYTFITGKSHNGPEASMRGFDFGAKLYGLTGGYYKPHFRLAYQDFREDGQYGKEHMYFVDGKNHDIKLTPLDDHLDHVGPHSSEIFAKAAVDFLEGYEKEQPFLMYIAFHAPHDTRNAPQKFHEMYPPEKIKLPVNFLPEHPFDNGDLHIRDEELAPFPRTVEDTKKQLSDYYAIITHMDEQIGKILEALKKEGFDKNTIIVFSSDSGLGMGSHGLFGKQNLYDDAGIHVPIVFCGPGIPKKQQKTDLCYSFDIFPTLCDLAGISIPESVKGISLEGSIREEKTVNAREELYFAYCSTQRAVRNKQYKLIEYCVDGAVHSQFFDLKNDPYETTDLSQMAEYAEKLKILKKSLNSHQLEEADWGQTFWNNYLKN